MAAADKDLIIALTLNDTPFSKAMDSARAKMRATIAEMERDSGMAMETLTRRIHRSVGGSAIGDFGAYQRDAASIYWRDRYKGPTPMGQEMVAPGVMSRGDAAAAMSRDSRSILQSWEAVTKLVFASKAAIELTSMATAAWAGRMKEVHEHANKLPPVIRESAKAGLAIGEPVAEWWTKQWFAGTGALGGKRARQLETEAATVTEEMRQAQRAAALQGLAGEFGIGAWEAQATEQQKAERQIYLRYQKNLARVGELGGVDDAGAQQARAAAQQQYIAETIALSRRVTEQQDQAREAEMAKKQQADKEKIEEEKKHGDELAGVRAAIAQRELGRQGRNLEAERQRIKENYRERIRDAVAAGQGELAAALTLLRDVEMGGVKGPATRGADFAAINTRYVDPAGLSMGRNQGQDIKDLKNLSQQQLAELKRLVSAMTEAN